jgi:NADH:ubiquinone oxidoreductase subunit 2 (subunit N)
MLLSLSLFFNLFINNLYISQFNYLKGLIIISFIILISFIIDYNNNISDIILLDGSLKINKMILFQEIFILFIFIFILISYIGFHIKKEYYLILIMNLISIIFLLESYDFLIFFLNWELYNLSLYILIISNEQSSQKSLSVSLKYFLLSAFSTIFFLLAIVL